MSPGKPAAKLRRPVTARPSAKAAAKPKRQSSIRSARPAKSAKAKPSKAASASTPKPAPAEPSTTAAVATAPPKKPSFYEAIAIYENGVRGLQRHDYASAAESFRQVLERYPEERELIERARLYLRVCERETAQRPDGPRTTAERVYAATMSLSAGDSDAALRHVQRALEEEPSSHRAHYMMAVIHSTRAESEKALQHLRKAIELNPDNRSLARQDADLERLRHYPPVRALLEDTGDEPKGRARARR